MSRQGKVENELIQQFNKANRAAERLYEPIWRHVYLITKTEGIAFLFIFTWSDSRLQLRTSLIIFSVDDLKLFIRFTCQEDFYSVQSNLNTISELCNDNHLSLNVSNVILFWKENESHYSGKKMSHIFQYSIQNEIMM